MAAQRAREPLTGPSDRNLRRKPAHTTAPRRAPAREPGERISPAVASGVLLDGGLVGAPATRGAIPPMTLNDYELTGILDEGEIAGVVPVPCAIAPWLRDAPAKTILKRFERAEDLDQWLHAPHRRLGGRTPFQRLVKCDASTVLQALAADRAHEPGAPAVPKGR